jgi:DNA ligase (NAD+)
MMSIDNGFDMAAIDKFHDRMTSQLGREPKYTVEYKVDGCALTLIYRDGLLTQALTRGDGNAGDDITHNARVIRGVPNELSCEDAPGEAVSQQFRDQCCDGVVEVRGEAYIPHSVFEEIVELQAAKGEEPFKNSRNATAGALRQLDPKECFRRGVHFVAHGLGMFEPDWPLDSYGLTMDGLWRMGIPTMDPPPGLTYENAKKAIQELVDEMDEIELPIDGIVIKLDKRADRAAIKQDSTRHVSWAMAYKWERYEAETQVVRFDTQVGKQGTLTPVVYFNPVEIAETTV